MHNVTIIVGIAGGIEYDFVLPHSVLMYFIEHPFIFHVLFKTAAYALFPFFYPYFLFMSFLSLDWLFNYCSLSFYSLVFFIFFFIKVLL